MHIFVYIYAHQTSLCILHCFIINLTGTSFASSSYWLTVKGNTNKYHKILIKLEFIRSVWYFGTTQVMYCLNIMAKRSLVPQYCTKLLLKLKQRSILLYPEWNNGFPRIYPWLCQRSARKPVLEKAAERTLCHRTNRRGWKCTGHY